MIQNKFEENLQNYLDSSKEEIKKIISSLEKKNITFQEIENMLYDIINGRTSLNWEESKEESSQDWYSSRQCYDEYGSYIGDKENE